jgi:hypothetical protein
MTIIKLLFLCVVAFAAVPIMAQEKTADTNMQILLEKVKADKKLVVAANMGLTEAEGQAFWPLYDSYQKDLQVINERLKKTILAYAEAYNKNALTDAAATQLTAEALESDLAELNLRRTYASRLARVLPAKKVARYLQIENKIRAAIRFDLASEIPLAP